MDNLFFIFSKLAWGLLSPSSLLIWLMILATIFLCINRTGLAKMILIPLSMFSLALLAYPISDWLMEPLETRFSKPASLPEAIDGIIMLGGGESLKESLSWNSAELGRGADRYIGAAELAKKYPSVPVIFSGGSGLLQLQGSGKEGSIAHSILTTIGIDPSRLIIESQSRNTYENFLLVKSELPKRDGHYVLVTSAFHMPRAIGIAREQHINVIAYPVDYRSNKRELRQFDFDFYQHLSVLETAWREWIGLTVYYLSGKTSQWLPAQNSTHISPNPTHNVNYPD